MVASTSRPNETRFLRDVPVPGVRRMPWGLEGESYVILSGMVGLEVFFSDFVTAALVSLLGASFTGAGVPNRARLKARAAKTGAGVSG